METDELGKHLVVGGKIYAYCHWCGKMVRLNKLILGSLHICLTEEEKDAKAKRMKWKP